MNEVRIRKRLNRIKRKIKGEGMIKEKKGKIKNMENIEKLITILLLMDE